jgi:DNA-binding CsgD family transcriptional regulator
LHTGDARLTAETALLAKPVLDSPAPGLRRHAAWLLALQAMARSDAERAHSVLAALEQDGVDTVLPLYPMDVTDPPQLVRIAMASGQDAMARATSAVAGERALINPDVPSVGGAAAHCRGLLESDVDALTTAVELLTGSPRPLALASALEDCGRALVAAGDKETGIERLTLALETYARLGATWDAGRVRGRLRALGVRRRITPSSRPAKGWAGLTESELVVARLVGEGLTNREVAERLYVSPHTVGMHLRHAFAKLDISSRVELARIARVTG